MSKEINRVRTRSGRRQAGVAAVELALVLGVLLAILFGATELGRAVYLYDSLAKSTRSAVRYLTVYDASKPVVRERAACIAVYGSPACTGAPLIPGLSLANIRVDDPSTAPELAGVSVHGGANGTIDLVRVEIDGYRFTSLLPFVVPDIRFSTISALMPRSFF